MSANIITVMYSAMAGIAVFAIVQIATSDDRRVDQVRSLICVFALLLIHVAGQLAISTRLFEWAPHLAGAELPFVTLLGPALYFYVRAMKARKPRRFAGSDWWVLSGPLLVALIMLPFSQVSAPDKLALANPVTRDPDLFLLALTTRAAAIVVFSVFTAIYLIGALRLQFTHKVNVKRVYSNLEKRSLDWLKMLLAAWALGWIAFVFTDALWLAGVSPVGTGAISAVFEAVAFSAFAHFALNQPAIYDDETEHADTGADRQPILTEDHMTRIARKLDAAMIGQHLYKESGLSLRRLSDETSIKENYISETFSQHLRTNFYDFVNGYRLKEAASLLEDTDTNILNIAYDVGFNSRSTFNSAFKKLFGMPPSEYRNRQSAIAG
tara:strand:+ start:382 stop:1524 length:1143 start_codon:yes stop_codon:yes gene_type:complete